MRHKNSRHESRLTTVLLVKGAYKVFQLRVLEGLI